jgi:V8-like Glu-specific endopeptidase
MLAKFDKETIRRITDEILGREQEKPIKKKYTDFTHSETGAESAIRQNVVPYDKYKNDSMMERIIDQSELLPAYFLEEGALVLKTVARVNIPGSGFGTGFLISKSLFMTNNHVLERPQDAQRAQFEFNYQLDYQGRTQPTDTYYANTNDLFYTNPQDNLDFTIVRLNGNPGDRWGYYRLRIRNFAINQVCNIIQHPSARFKEVSLQDNRVERILPKAVRYRTDTEPGSSGSPVFDNEWELIALHHAAGDQDPQTGKWLNNEGIRIDMVIQDLKNNFQRSPDGQRVLAELGIQS